MTKEDRALVTKLREEAAKLHVHYSVIGKRRAALMQAAANRIVELSF